MKAMESTHRNILFTTTPAKGAGQSWLARAGDWLLRRRIRGVGADIARADGMFAALDRWLWKQRVRETEAWLAQSQDVFELEARIRQLERGSGHPWR